MATEDGANDVWSMLGAAGSTVANLYRDVTLAKINAQTQSAPQGSPGKSITNPPPGMFGAFPQAQTKPGYDSATGGMGAWLWIAVAFVGALLILRVR